MTNVGIHSVRERAGDDVEVDWGDLNLTHGGDKKPRNPLLSMVSGKNHMPCDATLR